MARRFVVASVPSQPDNNPEHWRLFTSDSLASLSMDAGAEPVQIEHVRGYRAAVVR